MFDRLTIIYLLFLCSKSCTQEAFVLLVLSLLSTIFLINYDWHFWIIYFEPFKKNQTKFLLSHPVHTKQNLSLILQHCIKEKKNTKLPLYRKGRTCCGGETLFLRDPLFVASWAELSAEGNKKSVCVCNIRSGNSWSTKNTQKWVVLPVWVEMCVCASR